jgi:putative transposase
MVVDGRGADESAPVRLKTTGPNPTDRGKQGVKRSVLTEANGIPVAVVIDGANRHDMKLLGSTLEGIMAKRPEPAVDKPQGLLSGQGL